MEIPKAEDALVPQVPPEVRLCCFLGSSFVFVAQTLPRERGRSWKPTLLRGELGT